MTMTLTEPLSPIGAGDRIVAMDVLRGFALLGILLMNIEAFVGPLFGAITGLDPALRGADRFADAAIYLLVQGKFYTLFSLLFGMGFAVMLARAQAAGRGFVGVYLRRTAMLLAIGLVHALLLWSGDILTAYAVLAPALLLFRNTPTARLPVWALVLYLLPIALVLALGALGSLAQLVPAAAKEMDAALAEQGRVMGDALDAQRRIYADGTYAEAVARRVADMRLFFTHVATVMGWQIVGLFLLGAWFVRSGAIANPESHARLYARLRTVGFPIGLALTLASFVLLPTVDFARMDLVSSAATALALAGSLLMCLGYLAWIVRGLQSPAWAPRLALLAPAGRMALTNYLMQTVVCTFVFYGYGLGYFEQLPRAWQVPFVLALFALQVAASHWWLRRFRMGPMEWLWRAATYLRLPPLRHAATA